MKTRRFILTLLAFTSAFASHLFAQHGEPSRRGYAAKLISPRAGEVLRPGQVVRIEWTAAFPEVDLTMCETEILLSLDGGATPYMFVTSQRNPKVQHFDWTVPNTPTNTAVLDIRFGCLNLYTETSSIQVQSTFVISR